MNLETAELKRQIMLALGNGVDETSLPNYVDSFMEMSNAVVHVVADGPDRDFRVTLTEVSEDEYFKPYDPVHEE